jgi:RHS repeat-associated protein
VRGSSDQSVIAYLYDGSQLTTMGGVIGSGGSAINDVLITEVDAHPSGGLTGFQAIPFALGQQPVVSSYAYHPADHRLAAAATYKDWEAIQDITYSYDTAGNLRQSVDELGELVELDQTFSYDALHRLAEVEATGEHGYGTHRYEYDDAGNLRSKGPAAASGELTLHYDRTPGQPTHIAAVDLLAGGSSVPNAGLYTADADGGITSRTHFGLFTTSFNRNADGRIQGVGLPAPNESLVNHYDDTGERSEKLHLGAYASVIADRYYVDPSFEVDTVNNTHEVHFFLGGRRVATSKRTGLGIEQTPPSVSEVTTYHPDQVGTNTVTTTSTASSQTVSKTFLDPFGAKQSGTGTEPRHLFTDQERDAETGLDYFHARFYDPWIGRFLEQDGALIGAAAGGTFEGISGDAGNLNAYAYVLNRPTGMVDPTGLEGEEVDFVMSGGDAGFIGTSGGLAAMSEAGDVATCGNLSMSGLSNESISKEAAGSNSAAETGGTEQQAFLGPEAAPVAAGAAAEATKGSAVGRALSVLGAPFAAIAVLLTPSKASSPTISDLQENDASAFFNHYTNPFAQGLIEKDGFIKPSQDGFVYVTTTVYSSATTAQAQLSLTNTPSGYFQIPRANLPGVTPAGIVPPSGPHPGGGLQWVAPGPVPIGGAQWVPIGP